MRRPEQVIGALAVDETEQVVAVLGPAVRDLVHLTGEHCGEVDLLGADGVHLLAHDLFDLAQDPPAEREPGVAAGGGAADVAGPHEQAVAGNLGVRGVLAEGADEELTEAEHAVPNPTCDW